ncbi:MAG: RNA polymerase sigma-70 factor [Bacteroidales bacterium]|nr:RNA polymerase sigma-70 factor [Bacteroidales bacterium]
MDIIFKEIRKGNQKVFKAFFDRNYKRFVIYANSYLFDQQESEDIVQEVFVYIWENANQLNITASLNGYVLAMVRNRCLNYLRSIKITDNSNFIKFDVLNLVSENIIDSTDDEDRKIIYHQILKIIDTLPERMQQTVRLKFIYGYKYAEIAEELNISVNTVKTQLKRAKLKIIELLTSIILLLHYGA